MPAMKIIAQIVFATSVSALLLDAAAIPSAAQTTSPRDQSPKPNQSEIDAPNPQPPGFRIPLPPLAQMNADQRADFLREWKSMHTPIGPRAILDVVSPDVKAASASVVEQLHKSPLPQNLWQLTVLVTARNWDSQFEWWVHAPQAMAAGVAPDIVEAIRMGRIPKFTKPGEEAMYRYLTELYRDRKVSDATYERLRAVIGTRQLVEFTELAGYYNHVAMDIAAHQLPLRSDVKPPLPSLATRFPESKPGG
jgi:4-carboxymuconolactone decarboxylase